VVGQIQSFASEWRAGVWFAVPAFIYTLYNWLLYLNLVYFDPVRASAGAPLTPAARLISCPLPSFVLLADDCCLPPGLVSRAHQHARHLFRPVRYRTPLPLQLSLSITNFLVLLLFLFLLFLLV
jgi:hypothetical protein